MRKTTLNCRKLCAYPGSNRFTEKSWPKTEEYLIETADRCIRLARGGRELIEQLEAMGNELMAKAVELDTERDKQDNRRLAGPDRVVVVGIQKARPLGRAF